MNFFHHRPNTATAESNPTSPFPPLAPIPHSTHALFNRSPPFLPPPAFLRSSPSICRLRPPPKLQPFLVLIGVYGLVRPGKQRSLFSLRCLLLCCWWCGFCPFLGVQCVPPPFLENAPRWAALFALGCRLSLDSEASALGLGRAPLSRRGIWCGLMASCEDSAMQ